MICVCNFKRKKRVPIVSNLHDQNSVSVEPLGGLICSYSLNIDLISLLAFYVFPGISGASAVFKYKRKLFICFLFWLLCFSK